MLVDLARRYDARALIEGWSCSNGLWPYVPRYFSVEHTCLVNVHVQDCEESVRIAFLSIAFDGRSEERLAQDEVGQVMDLKGLCV